jgi:hypothetical protein
MLLFILLILTLSFDWSPQNSSGDPYILQSGSPEFTFGTVDFTNPDAVLWYTQVIQSNMIGQCQVCCWDYSFRSIQTRFCLFVFICGWQLLSTTTSLLLTRLPLQLHMKFAIRKTLSTSRMIIIVVNVVWLDGRLCRVSPVRCCAEQQHCICINTAQCIPYALVSGQPPSHRRRQGTMPASPPPKLTSFTPTNPSHAAVFNDSLG